MSIYLTALIKSKPDHTEELKALLLDLVAASRKEVAALQYDLHQSTDNPHQFIFHEEWASAADLAIHNAQPHLQQFVNDSKEIIDGGVIIYKTEKLA